LPIAFEIASKGTFDFALPRIMALDQVAIVSVHDPHEPSEVGSGAGIKCMAKRCRGEFSYEICDCFGGLF
jgi:hypothetical protein